MNAPLASSVAHACVPADNLNAALAIAARGIPVGPAHSMSGGRCTCGKADCSSPGKHPRTIHGLKDATRDPNRIAAWWGQWPDANVMAVTGAVAGIWVLDIDPDNGGAKTLAELEVTHGTLPPTVEVLTGGGGRHLYFRHPGNTVRNSAGKIGPGVDVRGDGGYVIAPPSNHASGSQYRWHAERVFGQIIIAKAPNWLLGMLIYPPSTPAIPGNEWRKLVSEGVVEGQRNDTIARLAGHLLGRSVDPHVALELLRAWSGARCHPPLPDAEVVATVESIARAEIARR